MLEALDPLFRRKRTSSDDEITVLLVKITGHQVELKGELSAIHVSLDRLTEQVAKTNGRVTELETHDRQREIDNAKRDGADGASADTLISMAQMRKLGALVAGITALQFLLQFLAEKV